MSRNRHKHRRWTRASDRAVKKSSSMRLRKQRRYRPTSTSLNRRRHAYRQIQVRACKELANASQGREDSGAKAVEKRLDQGMANVLRIRCDPGGGKGGKCIITTTRPRRMCCRTMKSSHWSAKDSIGVPFSIYRTSWSKKQEFGHFGSGLLTSARLFRKNGEGKETKSGPSSIAARMQ